MKKIISLILVLILLCSLTVSVSASNEVSVNIAPFPVYIDDMVIDSRYCEYPIITYKDVSYVPMTYHLAHKLKINCGWQSGKGFFLVNHSTKEFNAENAKPFGEYYVNPLQLRYTATIPTYDIYINGQKYENKAKEDSTDVFYPLLNFRNITYIPMTYDIAKNEFGWEINWNTDKWQLEINTNAYSILNPYIVKTENDHTVLKDSIEIYKTSTNENGETSYILDRTYYNHFILGHKQDILTRTDDKFENSYSYKNNSIDITEKTEIKDSGLYYDNKLLINLDNASSKVSSARLFEFKDRRFIDISINLNSEIPAPYTPVQKYLFTEVNEKYTQVNEWLSVYNLENIIPDGLGGYYLYSHSTSWQGSSRWSNNFSVLFYMDKDGNIQNLADKYKGYNSLYVVGEKDGNLYVKALYFNEPQASYGNENISVVNDGYFVLEKGTHNLKKLYPYTYGEPFVTKDGGFYLISCTPFEYRIINLLNGKVIKAQ